MENEPEYGKYLRNARKAAKLTQLELADKSGVAVNTIRLYESGAREPRIDLLRKLAITLSVPVDVLLGAIKEPDGSLIGNDVTFGLHLMELAEEEDEIKQKLAEEYAQKDREILTQYYESLNFIGKKEALRRVGEMTQLRCYQAKPTPKGKKKD